METQKHLIVTGSSEISWKDAITKTITEASKTIENLTTVKILEQKAQIKNDKIVQYSVDLDISFIINRDRD